MKIQSFTKKVTAVLTSLILVLSALLPAVWSLTVSAAEPERASGGSGAVCYLVPDNAGMSAVEVNDNGAMQLAQSAAGRDGSFARKEITAISAAPGRMRSSRFREAT